jgi:outer membrane protein assembly factor BamB
MRNRTRGAVLVSVLVCLPLTTSAWARDFPQWRGPNRNGHSDAKGLLKEWPTEGPKLLWQVDDLGSGYGTPSVAGGRIYLMSNRGLADEFVSALNASDGKLVWPVRVGKVGNPNQNPNFPAARSTPTVDGALVYALGSDGDLVCLESATGKVRWAKSLRGNFAGLAPTWAYAESPLVDGDVLVCVPGGSDATIVALDKRTGNVIWKSAVPGGGVAGYASVIIDNTGGVKQYIAYLAGGLVGGGAVRLTADQGTVTAEEAYFDPRLPTAIGGTVLVGPYLYGTSQTMMCVDYKTGQIRWNERGIGPASLLHAEGLLHVRGENGEVALVDASPEAYRERGRFTLPNPPSRKAMEQSWAYPVIADGRRYIRNADTMWCSDIRAPK